MEEVKRFMRYVLPGLVVAFELSLALYVSFPDKFACYAVTWFANGGFGTALAIFLASGALGYLFALIYYVAQIVFKKKLFYNHKPAIDWLRKEKNCIFEAGDQFDQFEDLKNDRRSQWELFNVVWHLSRGKHKSLEKIEGVLNRLLDVLHGHGAHFIGAAIGMVLWIVSVIWLFEYFVWWRVSIIIFCWVVLLFAVWRLYFKTKKTIENIQNTSLICALTCCPKKAKCEH